MNGAKERFDEGREYPFFHSPFFIASLSAFVYCMWLLKGGVCGIVALCALCALLVSQDRDLSVVVPFPFLLVLGIDDYQTVLRSLPVIGVCAGVLAMGFVVHIVRFPSFSGQGKRKFPVAVVITGTAILMGGTGVENRPFLPVVLIGSLAVLSVAFAYVFDFSEGERYRYDAEDLLLLSVLFAAITAFLQLLTVLFSSGNVIATIGGKYALHTGWGHPNYVGNVLARGIPAAMRYAKKKGKRYAWFIVLAFVLTGGVALTGSRSALLVGGGMLFLSALCPKKKRERFKTATFVLCLLIFATTVAFLFVNVGELFETYVRHGVDSSGRLALWKIGWERFLSRPVFGVGLEYDLGGRWQNNPGNTAYTPYWYHSTAVQIFACMGLFGVVAYGIFFYTQYKILLTRRSPLAGVAWTILAISLLDIYFFTPQEYLQTILLTTAGETSRRKSSA